MIFIRIKRKYEHQLIILAKLRKKVDLKFKTSFRDYHIVPVRILRALSGAPVPVKVWQSAVNQFLNPFL